MTTVTLLSAGDALDTGLMKNAFELRWVTGDEARLHPEADLILCFRRKLNCRPSRIRITPRR
jgi:hypothetical protein